MNIKHFNEQEMYEWLETSNKDLLIMFKERLEAALGIKLAYCASAMASLDDLSIVSAIITSKREIDCHVMHIVTDISLREAIEEK